MGRRALHPALRQGPRRRTPRRSPSTSGPCPPTCSTRGPASSPTCCGSVSPSLTCGSPRRSTGRNGPPRPASSRRGPRRRGSTPYAHLILEMLQNDPMLFIRGDEAEEAWRIIDPVMRPGGRTRCRCRSTPPARSHRRTQPDEHKSGPQIRPGKCHVAMSAASTWLWRAHGLRRASRDEAPHDADTMVRSAPEAVRALLTTQTRRADPSRRRCHLNRTRGPPAVPLSSSSSSSADRRGGLRVDPGAAQAAPGWTSAAAPAGHGAEGQAPENPATKPWP